MLRRLICSVITVTLLGGSAAAQQPPKSVVTSRVDSLAGAFLSATHTVLRGADTLVMKGYGDASVEHHRAATASTVYRIGSITKQFTAAAIMRLAERGKLSIDDPMTKYLPNVPTHGRTITILRLLNHTSGIHNYTAERDWRQHWTEAMTPRQIVAFVDRDSLDFKPGDAWSYSNTNFVLLGMIVEKVSGEPYARYLQEQFFTPLGLAQTSYCPDRPTDPSFADGYVAGREGTKPAEYLNMTQPLPRERSARRCATW